MTVVVNAASLLATTMKDSTRTPALVSDQLETLTVVILFDVVLDIIMAFVKPFKFIDISLLSYAKLRLVA